LPAMICCFRSSSVPAYWLIAELLTA
jgi:hypothetical protein